MSILLTTVLNFVSGCLLASISFSSISGDLSCYFIWNLFLCLCILAAFLGLFLCTVIPWYLSAIELVKPCICCILTRKIVSALSTCSGLITFPRNCMSHDDALQEKMLHCSVLINFGSHLKFWNELTMSTKVPLYYVELLHLLDLVEWPCVGIVGPSGTSSPVTQVGYSRCTPLWMCTLSCYS